MKKIKNPYANKEGYNCIGCSPNHPFGFKLNFFLNEETQQVVSEWTANENFTGYLNVVHGGIQSTLLDEIGSWAVYVLLKSAGVTSRLQMRYHKPVLISDGPFKLLAEVESFNRGLANIKTTLLNNREEVCTEGQIQYFVFPEQVAREKFHYPGIESFL